LPASRQTDPAPFDHHFPGQPVTVLEVAATVARDRAMPSRDTRIDVLLT
jgi:hypothetical protein